MPLHNETRCQSRQLTTITLLRTTATYRPLPVPFNTHTAPIGGARCRQARNSGKRLDCGRRKYGAGKRQVRSLVAQLQQIAELTSLSTVTGKTSQTERERLYEQFRSGARSGLILSGWQLALDLPMPTC